MTKSWAERLEQDRFTRQDKLDAKDWLTCAVGELDGIKRTSSSYFPVDVELIILGIKFGGNVRRQEMTQARATYEQIHKRAAELRNQEEAP